MSAGAGAELMNEVRAGWRANWNEDARQLVAVLLMAAVALLAGYGLRGYVEGQTRTVGAGGASADVPSGWIFQTGAQDLLFTVIDPRNPGQRYSVSRPTAAGANAASVADTTVAAKSHVLSQFQVVSRGSETIGGNSVPSVTYAYVTTRNAQLPQVIEGRDVFLQSSGGVLVVTLESPTHSFDNAIATFEQFAASVRG
jgi:hypothetical protein